MIFTNKFIRVYKKINLNKTKILKEIILPMYKQALKLSIAQKLYEKDSVDVEQTFKIAKRVEWEENFLKNEMEENSKKKKQVNDRIKGFNAKLLN